MDRPDPARTGHVRVVAGALATVLGAALLCVPALREQPATADPALGLAAAAELPWLPEPAPGPEAALDGVEPLVEPVTVEAGGAPAPAPSRAGRQAAPAPRAPQPRLEQRAREALEAISYPWQELGYTIRFEPHRGDNLLGLTDSGTRTITIFVRPTQSDHSLRATIAHEIGHALDFVTGGEAQRARYLELRGVEPGTDWFPCDACSDYASPAGDWAEVFALWLAGPGDFRSRLAGPPDAETLKAITPLFAPPSHRRSAAPPSAPPSPSPSPSPTGRPLVPFLPR